MSWDQFLAWYVFHTQVELVGEERADMRMGTLASLIANMFSGKGSKKFKPLDFMPYTKDPKVSERKPIRGQKQWKAFFNKFKEMFAGQIQKEKQKQQGE